MTVEELIKELNKHPKNADVWIWKENAFSTEPTAIGYKFQTAFKKDAVFIAIE